MLIQTSAATWYDQNYTYSVHLSISNSVRPYVYNFTISNLSGTNNATNMFCGGHCQKNYTDVIIVRNNATEVPHWNYNSTETYTKLFFNATVNDTYDVYYGNTSHESTNSGNGTFIDYRGNTTVGYVGEFKIPYLNVAYESKVVPTNAAHDLYMGLARGATTTWGNAATFIQSVTASNSRYIITYRTVVDASAVENPSFTNNTELFARFSNKKYPLLPVSFCAVNVELYKNTVAPCSGVGAPFAMK